MYYFFYQFHKNSRTCNCFAQAQRPKASFLESEILIEEMYLNVEHEINAKLCNHSVLEAEFQFGEVNLKLVSSPY